MVHPIKRQLRKAKWKAKKIAKDVLREAPAKFYVKQAPKRDPQLRKAYQRLRDHRGVVPFSSAEGIRMIAKDLQISGTEATSLFKKLRRTGCFRMTRTTWPV